MPDTTPVRNIVIVGGGSAGWMAAAALSKVLGTREQSITLIESDAIRTVGVGEATIPAIQLFNNVLGLDENEFIRETNATFKLAIEFVNWRSIGHRYLHPFGAFGVDWEGVSFMHYWLRWRKQGGNADIWKFNAESEASDRRRFMRTPDISQTMPGIRYAFHFDASLYAAFLRKFSEVRGAQRLEGQVVKVNRHAETGFIESLDLSDGRNIKGDFFIDCSGFRSLLLGGAMETEFDDWSRYLPVNRAAAMHSGKSGDLTPFTRATAHESGWQWRIPLQHRIGAGHVFCNEFISEDEATQVLLDRIDGEKLTDPHILRFVTGMRKKTWVKNCVAIGLASGFLEPLESTSLHLGQSGISRLLAHFPRRDCNPVLVERFNNEMRYEYESIRDFIITHYKITEREDTPFWRYVKNMDIPDALAAKLELFRARGDVQPSRTELFKESNWFAVLYGQGLVPEDYHPVADAMSEDELKARMKFVRDGVAERVKGMPGHQDFIDRTCPARPYQTA